jgi:uncharacterized membrane protein
MAQQDPPAKCGVCGTDRAEDLVPVETVRPDIAELIDRAKPGWRSTGFICRQDLVKYRHNYVLQMLGTERSELSNLDRSVLTSIQKQETLSEDVEAAYDQQISAGDRWADRIATFGGSWVFIGSFGAVLLVWIAINLSSLFASPFDPYPFILLNLLLSCLAAVQAPLIMMSQRRQEAKDRLRSRNDYRVNLKAELEIRLLHEKLDHLLIKQWQRLTEIQQIQLDIMEDIAENDRRKG